MLHDTVTTLVLLSFFQHITFSNDALQQMGHLTFRSAWVLKQLKSGAEVIFYILICSSGTTMWVCIKDSCKQLFLLQDSVAQSETVCLDFKIWNPKGAGF